MLRLLDMSVAASLLLLLMPAVLLVQVALASNNRRLHIGLQRSSFDRLPLLFQVLRGRLTIREWLRLMAYPVW